MIKNIKLALIFGILLWVIIFVVVSILIITPGIKDWPLIRSIINWILDAVAVFIIARIYFRKNPGNLWSGFIFGLFILAVGVVLDMAITVPFFIKAQVAKEYGLEPSYGEAAGVFFRDWKLLVGFAIGVLTAALTPLVTKSKVTPAEHKIPLFSPQSSERPPRAVPFKRPEQK